MCRVFICLIALRNIFVSLPLFETLYSGTSFWVTSDILYGFSFLDSYSGIIRSNAKIVIFLYTTSLILYVFGVGRRYIAIMTFILFDLIQRMSYITLNGGDNLLKFIFLYLCFADSFRYLSIKKSKPNFTQISDAPNLSIFINNLVVLSIKIHLCCAYLLSTFYKLNTEVWFNGLATYYTLSVERFQGTPWNQILAKNGFWVTITTYSTLAIELSFPFLVWFRQTKLFITVATIVLHFGIFIFMMIYDFQIIFIFLHIFFFNDNDIKSLWILLKNKLTTIFS